MTNRVTTEEHGMRSVKRRAGRPSKGSVLLADDDPVARKALGYVLRREGHVVAEVADGLALLDHVDHCLDSQRAPLPDVIVSDVCMPCVGGLDVLAGLRLSRLSIPIILVTAYRGPDTRAWADRLGPFALIDKPIVVSQLLDAIQRAIVRS